MTNELTSTQSPPLQARRSESGPDPGDLMAVVAFYQGPLLRYVRQLLGRNDIGTEDVVQETFIRLHRQVSIHGAKSILHLNTWLFHVAHNLALDLLRKKARQQGNALTSTDPSVGSQERASEDLDAVGEAIRKEARQVALKELAQIDEPCRQVILLKVVQGMTLREAAEAVGVSISTVNARLNQGLTILAQRLKRAEVL